MLIDAVAWHIGKYDNTRTGIYVRTRVNVGRELGSKEKGDNRLCYAQGIIEPHS